MDKIFQRIIQKNFSDLKEGDLFEVFEVLEVARSL